MNVGEVCFSLLINRSNNNLFSFCCKSLELNDLEIIGESICLPSLEIIAEDRFETFVGSFSEELDICTSLHSYSWNIAFKSIQSWKNQVFFVEEFDFHPIKLWMPRIVLIGAYPSGSSHILGWRGWEDKEKDLRYVRIDYLSKPKITKENLNILCQSSESMRLWVQEEWFSSYDSTL